MRPIAGLAASGVIAITLTSNISADVISGPIINPVNQHAYYLLSQDTWTNSESEAMALGGHLATIDDEAENDFVFNAFIAIQGPDAGFWIGLNDVETEGTFVWSSGEPSTYTNWANNEPNDHNTGEDHAHMFWQSDFRGDGSWNDAPNVNPAFEHPMHGVVEVVPEPDTPGDAKGDGERLSDQSRRRLGEQSARLACQRRLQQRWQGRRPRLHPLGQLLRPRAE